MIRSMTAFARAEQAGDEGTLSWELKSVNHRYLEVNFRLPDALRELEPRVRQRCRERLGRGKVEATLRLNGGGAAEWRLNEARVRELAGLTRRIEELLGSTAPVDPVRILDFPGVLAGASEPRDALRPQALALLDRALDDLVATREREGERLRELLRERLEILRGEADRVRTAVPGILEDLRARLRQRVADCADGADPERLETELALQAQKMDVAEELDRLDTHVGEVGRILDEGGTVGRRLDFLMQELNREANTLASKSVASETSRAAVEIKVLIEQMREQIQNVE